VVVVYGARPSLNRALKGALLIFRGAFRGSLGVQLWNDTGDKLKASSYASWGGFWLQPPPIFKGGKGAAKE
jgi:hypothetical protein